MDKEQEIRLQFLEEAQAYLDTIESAFLDLATLLHRNQIDAVLRAAHSIKGGAAMMGFEVLSELAHRFEDFFKILKYSKERLDLDADLENLFLAGVDYLRQIVEQYRRGSTISQNWLEAQVNPLMAQLHSRLGDFHPGDTTLTLVEDEQDMTALLFETEVEGGLQRLEALLDTPGQPCLLEEVKILAQELGGLGEMLELDPFIQLCHSILQYLEATPDQAEAIARRAVEFWRRSQTLVLAGQKRLLPTRIHLPQLEAEEDIPAFDPLTQTIGGTPLVVLPTFDDLDLSELAEEFSPAELDAAAAAFAEFVDEATNPVQETNQALDEAFYRDTTFTHAPESESAKVDEDTTFTHPTHPAVPDLGTADISVDAPSPLVAMAPAPTQGEAEVVGENSVILLGPIFEPVESLVNPPEIALDFSAATLVDLASVSLTTGARYDDDPNLEMISESVILLGPAELSDLAAETATVPPAEVTGANDLGIADESLLWDQQVLESLSFSEAAVDPIFDQALIEWIEAAPESLDLLALEPLSELPEEVEGSSAIAVNPEETEPQAVVAPDQAAELISLIQDSLADLLGPETDLPGELAIAPPSVPVLAPIQVTVDSPSQESGPLVRPERDTAPLTDGSSASGELQDNTVRVSVRQLDQINDLFGELAIERNGLDLHLGRLRHLVSILAYRTKALEKSNTRLRTAYDQVTTQGVVPGQLPPGVASVVPALVVSLTNRRANGQALAPGHTALAQDAGGLSHKFDSLEMDRYSDLHLLSQEVMETMVQIQEVTSDIELSLEDTNQTARDLNRTAKQLQVSLTQVRMRPLADVIGRFPRALRELCLQYGKKVELKTYGTATLFDRTVLEALSDPLMHLLRNSFDHGIEDGAIRRDRGKPETGLIEIRAAHRGNQTTITVSDDGGGIDLAKIRVRALQMGLDMDVIGGASDRDLLDLIFEPGFSTATEVTALSGRGVGMDVVRTNLKLVRGEVKVDTQLRRGTTFTITVPFTLSVIRVLLVESQGVLLAFPKDAIEEVILLNPKQVFATAGNDFLRWEGSAMPLLHLHRWLKFHCPYRTAETEDTPIINQPTILMVSEGEELRGIQVDRCWGEQEVTVRQVEGTLPLPPGFTGCTILGNGRVVPLVDAPGLIAQMMQSGPVGPPPLAAAPESLLEAAYQLPSVLPRHSPQATVLVVDDSIVVRRFLALTLERAGYRVEQAKDGQDALEKLMAGLRVQAIMCDIEMPRLDGYGFLSRVKSDPTLHTVPISMLTSRSGEKHRQLAMRLGAAAYFSKPYKEQELLQTLKQLIQAQDPVES